MELVLGRSFSFFSPGNVGMWDSDHTQALKLKMNDNIICDLCSEHGSKHLKMVVFKKYFQDLQLYIFPSIWADFANSYRRKGCIFMDSEYISAVLVLGHPVVP